MGLAFLFLFSRDKVIIGIGGEERKADLKNLAFAAPFRYP
jgi:hypothetical protein